MASGRMRRVTTAAAASVAALAGAATLTSSLVSAVAITLARQVVTLPSRTREPVRVVDIRPDPDRTSGVVVLQRTVEADAEGEYTMLWAGDTGRARILDRIEATDRTVTRRYADVEGASFEDVRAVRLASAPQRDIDDLGLEWSEVRIPTELGEAPAWLVPGDPDSTDWCIHIHGRGATLTEPLRTVPLVTSRGWNSLIIRYRNDPDAPRGVHGKSTLGLSEWRDVDAALEWAAARGAKRVVLVGWSMGGAIAVQTAWNSPFAHLIVGLMLESPALDWRETLTSQAAQMHVPASVANVGMRLMGSRLARPLLGVEAAIDLAELDVVARAAELRWPILLLASVRDTVVPVTGSQRLAQRRPDLVTYEEFSRARHTRLWNTDPQRWEAVVGQWFDKIGRG